MSEPPKKKQKAHHVSVIAEPLADKKLTKKLLRLNKKAAKEKGLRRGVKEVIKAIKKKEAGLCIIAGDISPIDVITHVPVLCEEAGINYVFVPSKEDLGASCGCKRPTSCVLVTLKSGSALEEKLTALVKQVKELPAPHKAQASLT